MLFPEDKFGSLESAIDAVIKFHSKSLLDSIQFLLNLTSGNGHLKIINKSGKFAYSLYNRENGNSIRVFIDIKNISPEKFPNIFKFFTRTRDSKVHTDRNFREESNKNIVAEFLNAEEKKRNKIFGWKKVHVKLPKKPELLPAKICSVCKESFLSKDAEICFKCAGDSYYDVI